MLAQLDVLLARADRQQFQAGRRDHVRKIRIGDQLHPMSAAGECRPQADHRMHVAIAANRGDDKLRHETPTEIQPAAKPPAETAAAAAPNFACHYRAVGRQWKWRFLFLQLPAPCSLLPALSMAARRSRSRQDVYGPPTTGFDCDDSDDAELELEPLDPEVMAAEERRAAEAIEVHRTAIDVNEVYRDLDANRDSEIVEEWVDRLRNFRFQFQVKHLLILTAVVAVLLVLQHVDRPRHDVHRRHHAGVAGVSLYLKLEENKRQEEADRRRQKMYAERQRGSKPGADGHAGTRRTTE